MIPEDMMGPWIERTMADHYVVPDPYDHLLQIELRSGSMSNILSVPTGWCWHFNDDSTGVITRYRWLQMEWGPEIEHDGDLSHPIPGAFYKINGKVYGSPNMTDYSVSDIDWTKTFKYQIAMVGDCSDDLSKFRKFFSSNPIM